MKRVVALFVLCLSFVGCDYAQTYVGVYDFEQLNWKSGQNVVFDYFTLTDKGFGDIHLSLRYLPKAVGQNVKLAVKTVESHNAYCVDTLDFQLDGGNGDGVRSVEMVVRKGVNWPTASPHHTVIMPIEDIDNVISLSLQIDNAKAVAQ